MKIKNSVSLMFTATLSAVVLLSLYMTVPVLSQMKDRPTIKEHKEEHRRILGMGNIDKIGDIVAIYIEQADEMGLTDDQIVKMKSIQNEIKKKDAQFRINLNIAEAEFMETMDVKDFDLKNADSAVIKISEIKTAHRLEMLNTMKGMWAILSEEQFNKMKKMISMCMCL